MAAQSAKKVDDRPILLRPAKGSRLREQLQHEANIQRRRSINEMAVIILEEYFEKKK